MNLAERIRKAARVYIVGNGGSYANAMHIQNDLLSCGVRAFTMDPATLTAFANDHGYYRAIAKWIGVVGEKGDLLIALSGSGRSPNILMAIEQAEKTGMEVERIFGNERGEDMQHAEEAQVRIGHDLLRELRGSPL